MVFALVLYFIICILLVITALFHQGQSTASGIFGGSSNSLLGTSQGSVLAKVVSFFAFLFFVGALLMNIFSSGERSFLLEEKHNTSEQENVSALEDDSEKTSDQDSEQLNDDLLKENSLDNESKDPNSTKK